RKERLTATEAKPDSAAVVKILVVALSCTVLFGTGFARADSPTAPIWHYGSMATASLGIGASLHGAVPFPATEAWNKDISKSPVDPNSAKLIRSIGLSTGLHPDFGSGNYDGAI